MDNSNAERVRAEVELLVSMYPDEVSHNTRAADVTFKNALSSLILRLPPGYPSGALPEILSLDARNLNQAALRTQLKRVISTQPAGDECLDVIIAAFISAVGDATTAAATDLAEKAADASAATPDACKTVVIWLHHLLAISKRKQALASDDPSISGLTKPGYPGVLVFSGPARNVEEHVSGLKALNWAAFQVRYEEDEKWEFEHGGGGVRECESMGELMQEVGERREVLLGVLRIK